MLDLTLPHKGIYLHLTPWHGNCEYCPYAETHRTIEDREVWFILAFVKSMRNDPITMTQLRGLLAQEGVISFPNHLDDGAVLDHVAHLLSVGRFRAMECHTGKVRSSATIPFEGNQIHVGLPADEFSACRYHQSHKALTLKDVAKLKRLEQSLRNHPEHIAGMGRLIAAYSGKTGWWQPDSKAVLQQFLALLAAGRLTAFECPASTAKLARDRVGGRDSQEEEQALAAAGSKERRPVEKKRLTWIKIELVDEDRAAVAYEKYRLELPDGSVREGNLDANGRAGVEDIDPGTCRISFPDIDGREWKSA
jgi:hypothetical protein